MSFFPSARNFSIHGGEFTLVDNRQTFQIPGSADANKILAPVVNYAVTSAFYDAEQRFPPPNCHPQTQTVRAYWLYGPAGVGKSAIAQNLSEKHAGHRLAASFFFSRNDRTRDKLDPFVCTIIYQFLTSEALRAVLGPFITDAIRSDPKIFRRSFETQFRRLILEPCFRVSSAGWEMLPNLVIIDGLDECLDMSSQERLLTMIREAVASVLAFRLTFLIASRPEPQIHRGFGHEDFSLRLGRVAIGDDKGATRDIATYFRDEFSALRKRHPALRHTDMSHWPGEDVVHQLVQRACGQFIFAVTVIKYLKSEDDAPKERLNAILSIGTEKLSASPYPDLDLLYRQILQACPNWDKTRRIISLLMTPNYHESRHENYRRDGFRCFGSTGLHCDLITWRSTRVIALLLELEPGEVRSLIFRLHAVLGVPRSHDADIRILHASFTEFLLDSTRSGSYHVKGLAKSEYLDYLVQLLLRTLPFWSKNFPPYHHQSFGSALELWKRDLCVGERLTGGLTGRLTTGPAERINDRLTLYSLDCLSFLPVVESPSDDLLMALDQFDPYPVASAVLNMGHNFASGALQRFFRNCKQAVVWAKALGARSPKAFIKSLISILRGFRVGVSSATVQVWPGASTYCESVLAGGISHDISGFKSGESEVREYNPPSEWLITPVLIFSIIKQTPAHWFVTCATHKKGEELNKLALLFAAEHPTILGRLFKDLLFETSHYHLSPLALLKRWHLYRIKKLLAKRRKELGLPKAPSVTPQTHYAPLSRIPILSPPPFNSIPFIPPLHTPSSSSSSSSSSFSSSPPSPLPRSVSTTSPVLPPPLPRPHPIPLPLVYPSI
ncbi:nwd2 [Moniliophthora roreri MCA 2997]|uniref:Nwd2 n=1 Tax=Moniliophthora roreri (strain MCA 2997) TaxID=1381753 RepID=V2WMC1_MONRO|nr:nwd2 [Moniliophthora roreri MCA 2997]